MQAMTPVTPLERGGEMFTKPRTRSVFLETWSRPLSMATTDAETEFEGDSGSEIEFTASPEGSDFGDGQVSSQDSASLQGGKRRSQTTISSLDEAPTPRSGRGQRVLPSRLQSVEGPKGPHLFRSSQTSGEFDFEYALQMSPMLPKQMDLRTGTAFSQDSVILPDQSFDFSIDEFVQRHAMPSDTSSEVRRWSSTRVIDWLVDSEMEPAIIRCFEDHDITGDVLLDLSFDDLRDIGIESFGKRHALWSALCVLQGRDGDVSPHRTPFQDVSRPITTQPYDTCETPIDGNMTPVEGGTKKRRGRKPSKTLDVITPAESVSIVAIEQLIPKPHKCAKGERCSKWRKQQREMQRLHDEHSIGRFPISPTKGGRIFVAGDPGNALTAGNLLRPPQPDSFYRPQSDAMPSVVASSDLLGPGQLPELHADVLDQLDKRDPLENVKAFIHFQHVQMPSPPAEDDLADAILTPAQAQFAVEDQAKSTAYELFPAEHIAPFSALSSEQPLLQPTVRGQHEQLKTLPRLDIPRTSSAQANLNSARTPVTATEILRSTTASPGQVYRFATPASEMDVPVNVVSVAPISRSTSQSVPPDMQFREQQREGNNAPRSQSRVKAWRRPSMALEAVKEHEIYSTPSAAPRPSMSSQRTGSSGCTSSSGDTASRKTVPDPAHHEPEVKIFGYGADCTQAGWMRKRRTKMLRHEWQDAHFRLKGSHLAMHADDRLKTAAKETINVDQYSVACSTAPSNGKLGAAFKSLSIKNSSPEKKAKDGDGTAFAFQLIPEQEGPAKLTHAKTHHFAVKSKDERIDWMRELMLAKALQQKRAGYEVQINGVRA